MAATAPSPDPFSLAVLPGTEEAVVVPAGELDAGSATELDRTVRDLRAGGAEALVLDLRALTFVDSAGLRLLLSMRNDAKRDGHDLTLIPGSREVQRVFELTATRTLFDWRAR